MKTNIIYLFYFTFLKPSLVITVLFEGLFFTKDDSAGFDPSLLVNLLEEDLRSSLDSDDLSDELNFLFGDLKPSFLFAGFDPSLLVNLLEEDLR